MSAPNTDEPGRHGDTEELFLEHLDLIERVAQFAGRRSGFASQDIEDFVSTVKVKLIEDDYAVLRKHRGQSKLSTYLTTVVHNLFRDFRNHKLGKYRASAKAKQLGEEAEWLEQLLVRDRHDLDTAVEIMKTNMRVRQSRKELIELAARLPPRTTRRFVGEEALDRHQEGGGHDRGLVERDLARSAEQVERTLDRALKELTTEDLLILKMHFRDGLTIAAIASALRLQQRSLYSRKDRCLKKLRSAFLSEGLTWGQVREILGWQGRELRTEFGPNPGKIGDTVVQSGRGQTEEDRT